MEMTKKISADIMCIVFSIWWLVNIMRRTFISKFPNANLPLISINLEFVKWGNSDLFVGSHELLKYLRRVQPAPSMTSLVCSDPSKMVCSDPPRMVCSDP